MAKFGKKYRGILKALPKQAVSVEEAVKFIKAHPAAKFDETLDVSFKMGVELVKSDSPFISTIFARAASMQMRRVRREPTSWVSTISSRRSRRMAGAISMWQSPRWRP